MLAPTRAQISKELKHALLELPRRWEYKYDKSAKRSLLQILFRSLVGHDDRLLDLLFYGNTPGNDSDWNLRDAQGAVDGAEYTEAARGKPCGHILKGGEASYRCKTCSTDDTCVLCSRCFEASDHIGHMVSVNISPGNSGCCDCGDAEAWIRPMQCAIHSPLPSDGSGKRAEAPGIPEHLLESIKGTVSAILDYMCDVISCAPEELRKAKSEDSIKEDEVQSRLLESVYGTAEYIDPDPQYALILWNDEKHTLLEVQQQVARACKDTKAFGLEKAHETDDIGRSVILVSRHLPDLLRKAAVIEQIKITVTIRSARDTFREQMCSTIMDWLLDISGCTVGDNHDVLRETICQELLQPWEQGSSASNAKIGRDGIYDHEIEDAQEERRILNQRRIVGDITMNLTPGVPVAVPIATLTNPAEPEAETGDETPTQDAMEVDTERDWSEADLEMRGDDAEAIRAEPDDSLEVEEATMAGYPPPPPPPTVPPSTSSYAPRSDSAGPGTSEQSNASPFSQEIRIPQTPYSHARRRADKAPLYWLERNFTPGEHTPLAEDIHQRLRLDWMILYDLRLWKKARVDLRDLYIGTVVTIPEFKRILGLRFAGLYTVLAQLYLIADREPDHSIIYLSLQMLTAPSITREVVDKCDFLTTLIAILYTFLTTRQVGSALDVSPNATLAFDAGSVTNRRMYHFFMDLKHLFSNEYVQGQLRENENYTLQFLDLIKLPQGICPNTRAVGEHVEYETDAWISASILTREVNKLCRQFAEAFKLAPGQDRTRGAENIRRVALTTLMNCLGLERERFKQAEIKRAARFHEVPSSLWGEAAAKAKPVVKFVVEEEPISFHHPMHYTLSWLIEGAKSMSANDLKSLLSFRAQEIVNSLSVVPSWATNLLKWDPETYLLVLFDFPLRVCAWLTQMKAGMWVRNGLSLRHQMSQYRGVNHRNLAHQHDLFLLQVALVTCDPDRVLVSMIDRFAIKGFMCGYYAANRGTNVPTDLVSVYDEPQLLEVVEDFIHLLIVLLGERTMLQPLESDESQQAISIRRDLTHVLCFKPLSYSDLCSRLIDKFQDLDEFQDILNEMTNYKPPEGVADVGTFELKKEYLTDLDPYIAHYTKNQRDEAETTYRKWKSEQTGKAVEELVFEPRLRPITSGVFSALSAFTGCSAFHNIVQHCLSFALNSQDHLENIPVTRIESFLQIVLHLILISVNEDMTQEDDMNDDSESSFVRRLLVSTPTSQATVTLLYSILNKKEFEACHAKIKLILLRTQQKRPQLFQITLNAHGMHLDETIDRQADVGEDAAAKKKAAALARNKKVMAAFKQQQNDFLTNQSSVDWGFDDDDSITSEKDDVLQMWDYPSGNCIYCQEECGDSHLYGTFALIQESCILRLTDVTDVEHVQEVLDLPQSLDHSAEAIRPYGIAGKNFDTVKKFDATGAEITIKRQTLGKGWKPDNCHPGPVSKSCGHIMHYSCFELYFSATIRRHAHQIARHHPENLQRLEFICPLCKALANTFVPVLRKGAEKKSVNAMVPSTTFDDWLLESMKNAAAKRGKLPETHSEHTENSRSPGTVIDWAPETLASGPLFSSDDPGPAVQMTPSTSRDSSMSPIVSGIANMPGNFLPDESQGSPPPMTLSSQLCEQPVVRNVCHRLKDTIEKNELVSNFVYQPTNKIPEQLCHTDALVSTIGYTIAATEIAQRGVASESAGTYVTSLPSVTLTHLRLLKDFFEVYTASGRLQQKSGRAEDEMNRLAQRQLQQLFSGHPKVFDTPPIGFRFEPVLAVDAFVTLAETTSFFEHVFDKDFHHMMRLCYLLELVKNAHSIYRDVIDGRTLNFSTTQQASTEETELAEAFLEFLSFCGLPHAANHDLLSSKVFALYAIRRIRPYATVFLRKALLWVHVVKEIDTASLSFDDPDEAELDRLTRVLRLPSLHEMLKGAGTATNPDAVSVLHSMVLSWIAQFYEQYGRADFFSMGTDGLIASQPAHPAIFELVGLPKYYDTLLDEMMRRRCPTRPKRDLTDPALCLFCGDIFCGQAVCCTKDDVGGCNRHMEKCGKDVGLFLMLRKCTVLYLVNECGSFVNAPYLDRHGEVDQGLRRNRQLMLNKKRYDALLRTVWLNHMIPTTIARQLEAVIDPGGWLTM